LSQKSVLNSYKNKLILSNIQKTDPKLVTLIKKFQLAESENSKLKIDLNSFKQLKSKLTLDYFSITCNFLEEEKLKQKIRELEKNCDEKNELIEKLSNILASLKQKLTLPFPSQALSRLKVLHEDLKQEQRTFIDDMKRVQTEHETICALIASYSTSPKKRSASADKLKEQLSLQTTRKSELDKKIRSKEIYRNNVKVILDKAQTSSKDASFAETERKHLSVNLGKPLKEDSKPLNVLKSFSKPGTPLTTKLVELNRGFFFNK
jgi:chromosome segregation ATPase